MTIFSVIFVVLSLVLTVLRTILTLCAIEPDTGFYGGMPALVLVQNVLFVFSAVGLAAWVLWRVPKNGKVCPGRFVKPMALLLGAGGLLGCLSGLIGLWTGLLAFTQGSEEVTLIGLMARVLAVPGALGLLAMSVPLFRTGQYRWGLWGSALASVWMTVEAVACFMAYPTIANISDQTLEVAALCMGALFWLAHTRAVAQEKTLACVPRQAKLWGLFFGLFAVPLSIAQFCGLLTGQVCAVHMSPLRQGMLLFLGCYAALWSLSLRMEK